MIPASPSRRRFLGGAGTAALAAALDPRRAFAATPAGYPQRFIVLSHGEGIGGIAGRHA